MKKKCVKVVLLLILFLVLVGGLWWFGLYYYKTCENQECFNSALQKCSRVRFVSQSNMLFEYKILSRWWKFWKRDKCEVSVKLIRGDLSNQDSLVLEGKSMRCSIPFGMIIAPESDINNCHGLLKEGLQDLIINKMHSYIVENINEISEEIKGL